MVFSIRHKEGRVTCRRVGNFAFFFSVASNGCFLFFDHDGVLPRRRSTPFHYFSPQAGASCQRTEQKRDLSQCYDSVSPQYHIFHTTILDARYNRPHRLPCEYRILRTNRVTTTTIKRTRTTICDSYHLLLYSQRPRHGVRVPCRRPPQWKPRLYPNAIRAVPITAAPKSPTMCITIMMPSS